MLMRFLSFIGICTLVCALPQKIHADETAEQDHTSTPNILWIIAEDFSPDAGCYGNKLARTFHLDRLAEEGRMFTSAFTSAPSCCPSRSGFMTGMWQNAICTPHQRPAIKKDLPERVHVITKYFRDAGYFCVNLRQVYKVPYNTIGSGKDDFAFIPHEKVWDSHQWEDLKIHQPFYTQITIGTTHRGGRWTKCAAIPEFQVNPDSVVVPPYYPDIPIVREDFADYYASMHALDEAVGELLKRLKDDGLADNTVVMFIGDHGRPMLRGKQFLYEQGIHIPLIIRWPGKIQAGTTDDQLVSALDFAPTFLKIAGAQVPSHLHGRNFLGRDQGPPREYIFASRDRVDEATDRIRCVRSKRYKYIRNDMPEKPYAQAQMYREMVYPTRTPLMKMAASGELDPVQARFFLPFKPKEELYDLKNDPWEINNLVGDVRYQDTLNRLRVDLEDRIREVGDMAALPEPEEEYVLIMHQFEARRKKWEESGELPRTWGQIQREKTK
jgi:arylsulfatase A-like enzyme